MRKPAWDSIQRFDDHREHVSKFVLTKGDAIAEAVLYRYPTYAERTVLCCSVQSGCPVGCVFCGTGAKFMRSLTVDEITSQAHAILPTTMVSPLEMQRLQIMFMSMGEPLLNPRIYQALRDLHFSYPNAELLISTIAPRVPFGRLLEVSKEIDKIGLQFSIHATTNVRRDRLIPFRKKLLLKEIAEFGTEWRAWTGRRPFINYIATPENATEADAKRLAALFPPDGWQVTVSVLCSTDGKPRAEDSSRATWFANQLLCLGFSSRVFDPAGQDTIGGGCGQLWYVQDWMRSRR